MKLNKSLLEKSMENAKANFNKVCDKIMEAFKKMNNSIDDFQKEVIGQNEEECKCKCDCCHCHDKDEDEVQEAVEPEFEEQPKDEE